MRYQAVPFEILKGKTIIDLDINKDNTKREDQIVFTCSDGVAYRMCHHQDCCEDVVIEEFIGEREWLIGSPVLVAEERSNSESGQNRGNSETWTFYEIATLKGSVTIRWYGSSNGYYSESVDFEELP